MASQMLQYINSEKCKPRLIVAGYTYYKDYNYNNTIYWRCVHYKSLYCKARVHTVNQVVSKMVATHNHAADAAKNIADGIVENVKKSALDTTQSPHELASAAYDGAPLSVAAELPQNSCLKRAIRRIRQNDSCFPNENPNSREELNMYDQFKVTNKGDEFLLFDSGKVSDRILIFGTKRNLLLLSQFSEWYSDDTFKTCPKLFGQFYTIHIIKNNKSFPLIYALLPNKSQSTYLKLLQKINELQPDLSPTSILTDLEHAAINAYKEIFPTISIRLCYFHFKQCLYRKIQAEGLKSSYDLDADFAKKIRMIAALAFIKKEHVEETFILLASKMPDICEGFLEYFGKEFVGYVNVRGAIKPGLFPIEMWNIYNNLSLPKTNNHIEGWHRGFAELVHENHPSIWKFFNFLKIEQGKNELIYHQFIAQVDCGPPTKKKYLDQWERINKIINEYETTDRMEFLEAIALNIIF